MNSRLPALGIAALILTDLVLAGGAPSSSTAPRAGSMLAPTGSMHVPRAVHTATLLPDGRVLVAGGMQKNGVFEDSAELYDPASGRFEMLPKLSSRRVGHSATLLPSGRVLIVGGSAGRRFEGGRWIGDVVATAELYDPATHSFRSAGSMSAPRAHQAAVRLADGRVLLAGGYNASSDALGSAEIYDPASGAFRATGSLKTPRTPDAAVLLKDGRVLIPGGSDASGSVLASAEIYDPKTGSFSPAGEMIAARRKHGGILLASGRVLVVGGSDARDWSGQKTETEIYDPAVNLFAPASSMALRRFKLGSAVAMLLDGRVLVAGGAWAPELYDPARGRVPSGLGRLRSAALLRHGDHPRGRPRPDHRWLRNRHTHRRPPLHERRLALHALTGRAARYRYQEPARPRPLRRGADEVGRRWWDAGDRRKKPWARG